MGGTLGLEDSRLLELPVIVILHIDLVTFLMLLLNSLRHLPLNLWLYSDFILLRQLRPLLASLDAGPSALICAAAGGLPARNIDLLDLTLKLLFLKAAFAFLYLIR